VQSCIPGQLHHLPRFCLREREPLPDWRPVGRQEEEKEESVHHKEEKQAHPQESQTRHLHPLLRRRYFPYHLGKGNVTQQRKTCPSCGPGTFMAQHWDRYYCGFCHTTIKMDAETIKKNE
jgi:ribosomal protein S27AE